MSFDVFVSGRGSKGGPHYSHIKKGYPDLKDWELSPLMKRILKLAGVDEPPSLDGGVMKKALAKYTTMEMLNFFFIGLSGLLMVSPGQLSIHVKHKHLLWPTSSDHKIFYLDAARGGGSTSREILKFLKNNDMNNWGALLKLAEVFTEFTASKYKVKPGFYLNVTFTD